MSSQRPILTIAAVVAIRKAAYIAFLLATPLIAAPSPSAAEHQTPGRAALEAEMARMAQDAGGKVGVMALHLETGLTLSMNDNEAFPMASTFKIAVAGAILAKVDQGQLTLNQLIAVDPKHFLSSEGIAETFPFPGVSASVHNLIESMLTRSDNTATNVLTELAGGPAAVTAWVKGLGVEGMRIDGDTNGIVGRFYGLSPANGTVEAQLAKMSTASSIVAPSAAFDNDPRDTTTPRAMISLLSKIADGHALSSASTEVLLGSMERCITGLKRLRGQLPPGVLVSDKTGTIGGTVNDVGIISLPNNRGRVLIAVYIKKSAKPVEERERVIAEIARSVYDYMLIESANK
jgi:beta-lactamase class A